MKYAIIGGGHVGTALARQFGRRRIDVAIATRGGPESLVSLARELGSTVVACSLESALGADVVFLAIPFAALESVARAASSWMGKIVVDMMNARELVPAPSGPQSADLVAAAMPGARVVKAFNHLPAAVLAEEPEEGGGRRVVFVASNDEDASAAVARLAEQLGFAPIELGKMSEGGALLRFRGPLMLQHLVKMD
jgi:predicted dinucleotide-binding enzyme